MDRNKTGKTQYHLKPHKVPAVTMSVKLVKTYYTLAWDQERGLSHKHILQRILSPEMFHFPIQNMKIKLLDI